MSTYDEIKKTLKKLNKFGNNNITILHCVSSYPAKEESLNLNVVDELKKRFRTKIGYSDHSLGTEACLAAIAKGASTVEKHVTTSKLLKGPDHKTSITIKGFEILVKKIRKLEVILGSSKKKFSNEEINVRNVSRKSLVTNKAITKGSILKKSDIVFKRPGTGISPLDIKKFIGRKLIVNKEKNRVIFKKELK